MSTTPNLFMFSGQGSHYYQMGSELFAHEPIFRRSMLEQDELARELLGLSIVDLLYHQGKEKSEVFERTRFTSPAIFMVEYALAKTLIDSGVQPDGVLGVSLGIFAAGCVAGCLDAEDALRTVIRQAEILERDCPAGSMVAVLASPQIYEQQPALHANADLAGINFSSHFVLSTIRENLPPVLKFLNEKKLIHQVLAVSQAFHSRWIDAVRDPSLELFRSLKLKTPNIPVACSAQQGYIADITAEGLWNIMRNPIQLANTIRNLETQGPYRYIDVGPAGTLATVLKYRLPADSASVVHSILGLFPGEHKKHLRLLAELAPA